MSQPQMEMMPTVTRQKWPLPPEHVAELKELMVKAGLPPVIYKLTLFDQEFLFRPLFAADRAELDAFSNQEGRVTVEDRDEKVCSMALMFPMEILEPVQWQVQRAGLQETLSRNVRARSGYIVPGMDQSDYFRVEVVSEPDAGRKPTDEEVAQLKRTYNWGLILTKIGADWYVYRPISRAEWKALAAQGDEDINLRCCERAVVWTKEHPAKPDFDNAAGLAGLVDTIATLVMEVSGFDTPSVVEEL